MIFWVVRQSYGNSTFLKHYDGGGQFERLISLIKASLYRNIGKAQLTWAELEKLLLDIEIILNSRTLTYMEEEIDHPILTLNSLILERHTWWKWK